MRHAPRAVWAALATADGSFDTIISTGSGFRGVDPGEIAAADRLLRPSGRLLVVHDYGRDDISLLYAAQGERPEYGLWSRRDGPFLGNGFKVRVVHCWSGRFASMRSRDSRMYSAVTMRANTGWRRLR